jgi:hypothetical protein
MIRLGYSKQSAPSALAIAEVSDGAIIPVRTGPCDINWGRRRSESARLNADITNAVNKCIMRELFAEHDVLAPNLIVDQEDAERSVADGIRLVGRPDFHTRGRGFWICDDLASVQQSATGVGRKRAATHWYEYVDPDSCPKEFRVHVFGNDSIRMSLKAHVKFHDYTTVKPPDGLPKRYIRNAAKSAMAAVGLDFGVVDILASEDQTRVWVLEVNAAPGLGGTTPQLWADTFMKWFDEEGEHG